MSQGTSVAHRPWGPLQPQPNARRHILKRQTHFTLAAMAAVTACIGGGAQAAEWTLDDGVKVKLNSAVTAGTAIRTESPDPAVYGSLAAARVGASGAQLSGNSGGNDFNFANHQPVSTVLKGLFDLELSKGNIGVFLRARAWTDHELEHGNRAYGNIPNGFAQNVPLSDQGFDDRAKFTNAVIDDVNLFGRSKLEGKDLDWRVGRQVLSWGQAQFIGGGINAINPVDAPASVRPGVLPEETRIPVGMLQGKLSVNPATTLQVWAQYEFRPNVLHPCGTFFATANYAPTGCDFVNVLGASGVNDPTALSSGRYPKRADDRLASGGGQFGLALGRRLENSDTEIRGYAMNYHSRSPFVQVTNANIPGSGNGYGTLAGSMNRLTDPNGLKYGLTYAENIQLFGASFSTAMDRATKVYGELAYRPNQPLQINASDLIGAFVQRGANNGGNSLLQLAKGVNALPPGATFDGYDRFKVSNLNLGINRVFQNLAGAARVVASAEVGLSHIAGLPDPANLRYGRSDDYGAAAYAGGPACTASAKTCALDGFVTANSWGYRLRVAGTYPGALMGATLIPSFTFGHDVSGYSHDGVFVEGRKTLRPAVRAEWGKQYFADVVYNRFQGGNYFTLVDHDTLTLSAGMKF